MTSGEASLQQVPPHSRIVRSDRAQKYEGAGFNGTRTLSEVKDNVGQNTTSLLAGCSYGVYGTCFGLLGGHHQVYKR